MYGRTAPLPAFGPVRPKLTVGAIQDPLEAEADRAAERVMRIGAADAQAAAGLPVQGGTQGTPRLRADMAVREGTELAPPVAAQIEGLHGRGRPMSESERAFFEPRFGADLAAVRLHHSAPATRASQAIGARAFTIGTDIAFGAGEYRPGTTTGRALMAHELAHVIQQGGAPRSLVQCNDRDITGLSMQERWAIVYASAIRGAGDGLVMAMIILLACILIMAAIAAILLAWLCPPCIAAISSLLSTMVWGATVSTWLMALLASFGVASALVTMQREFGQVSRAVETARTEEELQRAGQRWGQNTAEAFIEFITAAFAASSRVRGFAASLARRLPGRRASVGGSSTGTSLGSSPTTAPPGSTPVAPEVAAGFAPAHVAAFRRFISKPLTHPDIQILGQLWDDAARAGDAAILNAGNSRPLFNLHRDRFWARVRNNPAARAIFEDAGCQFESGAPYYMLNGQRIILTIDHIVERQAAPHLALTGSNLRISFWRENTVVLRLLNQLDIFQ